jgi:gliding motility-associated transport system ATP-binding protein
MLEVRHLTKYFNKKIAVDNISFTVNKGEVLGFLGPNGAGKSTTMRMITGFYPPSDGTVIIGGYDILTASVAARCKIGYLPESAPTYNDMTVTGFLDFIARVRGFSGKEKSQQIDRTIERCFLSDVRFQTIDTLSKGYNQRVCFAQCLLHDPEYLIMDEPTDGLDPNQKHEVRAMIREMAKNKTIVLSTHNLEEVDAICSRVIIIAEGRLLADDTPEGLKARSFDHGAVRYTIKDGDKASALREVNALPTVKTAEITDFTESEVSIRAYPKGPRSSLAEDIIQCLKKNGRTAKSLFVEEGRLEDVFRNITLDNIQQTADSDQNMLGS